MNSPKTSDVDSIKNFNIDFFKNIEKTEDDCQNYLNDICSKFDITDTGETKALNIYYFWNFYFNKLFPNIIEKKIKQDKDPRRSSLFKYCYKLQKETDGILDISEYKDYVYCQLRFLKSYKDKTNNVILVTPNILNLDKGWKKWKYFKYLLSKRNQSSISKSKLYVNNDNLKTLLIGDKKFLNNRLGILNKEKLINNKSQIALWHKIGGVSIYFLALSNLLDGNSIGKDLSVYNFDDNANKIYRSIFSELF